MADKVEQADIRGLDIDKTVKGFALRNYIFKSDCQISSTSGDSIRWYSETAADPTPTAPTVVANVSPLSQFPILEHSWTRNTSYPRKYAAEGFISMEDIKSADINVLARSLLRLTRSVVKQVDTRIYAVLTATGCQTFATTAVGGDQWDAASAAGNPIKDIAHCKKLVRDYDYDPSSAVLYIDPIAEEYLIDWLIGGKGSSIPAFHTSGDRGSISNGKVVEILGVTIKVSPNVTTDEAVFFLPKTSVTWYTFADTTARTIDEVGIGTKIRVWEIGEAVRTDPNSVVKITDINS